MDSQGSVKWQTRLLRAWHLGILRFVLTLDNADRLNVLAIANEIDRFGRREDNTDFVFFRRTGSELCAAIFHRSESSNVILRQYLARIDEVRLQRAFMAALDIELHDRAPVKKRLKQPIVEGTATMHQC